MFERHADENKLPVQNKLHGFRRTYALEARVRMI